jgi:hypothetical protein
VQEGIDDSKNIDIDDGSSKFDEKSANVSQSQIDLDYLDELELNRAFNVFKDI